MMWPFKRRVKPVSRGLVIGGTYRYKWEVDCPFEVHERTITRIIGDWVEYKLQGGAVFNRSKSDFIKEYTLIREPHSVVTVTTG